MAGLSARGHAAETPSGKVTKEVAKYQDQPNNNMQDHMGGMMGNRRGGMMPAGTCQVVEGSVNPMGWCLLYQPIPR
jgi:hypothetical protein